MIADNRLCLLTERFLSCVLSDARGDGEVDEEFWAQAAADQAQQAYPDDDNDNFGGQPHLPTLRPVFLSLIPLFLLYL